jgi:hypothetical protein
MEQLENSISGIGDKLGQSNKDKEIMNGTCKKV